MALDSFVNCPWLFSNIHSHRLCKKHNKQCSEKRKFNIIHACMFCAAKDSTGHTVNCGLSRDAHN